MSVFSRFPLPRFLTGAVKATALVGSIIALAHLTAAFPGAQARSGSDARAHGGSDAPTRNRDASAPAFAARLDTPSGLPVPRFVSIAGAPVNCRIGPSRSHPVKYVYRRAAAPVLVIAESTDHWRKVRDADGDECWAYHTVLAARSHVQAVRELAIFSAPQKGTILRGRLGPGVLARLVKTRRDRRGRLWALLEADQVRGWAPAADLWGLEAPRRDFAVLTAPAAP